MPSATAEGYRPRSTDALSPFIELMEAHILELAGVKFDREAEPGKLRVGLFFGFAATADIGDGKLTPKSLPHFGHPGSGIHRR